MCADVFGGEEIDGEASGGDQRHEIASAEMEVAREVGPDDDERAGESEGEAGPEGDGGAAFEGEPGDEADEDWSLVAEESGVRGGGADDGGVVEGEVEREEEAADGDDGERSWADARRAPVVEPCWDEE